MKIKIGSINTISKKSLVVEDRLECNTKRCQAISTRSINGHIKCKKNKMLRVLQDMEKLPNKYKIIKLPKGKTVSNENITIAAQKDI